MRSPLNVLDFVCLVMGVLELSNINVEGFFMLRLVRVLKPLRSIKAIPSLQLLIQSLISAIAGLVNVYIFLTFVLSFFAIFGVALFSGYQYRACRVTPELIYSLDGTPSWPKVDYDRLCNSDDSC